MVWKTSTSKTIFQISNNNTSGRLVIVTCKNVQSQLYLHGICILKLYYWVSHEHQTENSYFFWQLEDANIKTLKMYSLIFDALAYCEMITMVGLVNTSIISHNHHFFLSFFFFFFCIEKLRSTLLGNSLEIQWLRLHTCTAGVMSLILGPWFGN